jgi:hypothetical protein
MRMHTRTPTKAAPRQIVTTEFGGLSVSDDLDLRTLLHDLGGVAAKISDGHFTILKFTTNWRVGWGTPEGRCDIDRLFAGHTLVEAAAAALNAHTCELKESPNNHTHQVMREMGYTECPICDRIFVPSLKRKHDQ